MEDAGEATEDQVILAWLQAEIETPGFQQYLIGDPPNPANLSVALKLARSPNLRDAEQNRMRRQIITNTHGFGMGVGTFQGLANDIRWRRFKLTTGDVSEMLYASRSGAWTILAPVSRKVAEGATNVGHIFTGDPTNMVVLSLAYGINHSDKKVPEIIALRRPDGKLVILEGHARATAIVLEARRFSHGVDAYVGDSPSVANWAYAEPDNAQLMPQLSDFRLGADVVASDGSTAGRLASVLVEKDGFVPKALVIEVSLRGRVLPDERLFVTDELIIPIKAVASATHDLVRLSMSGADIRRQPPYLSYRLEAQTAERSLLEEAQLLGGGLGMPSAHEVANKPPGQIEIDRDEKVMLGNTGRPLGTIRDLLYDRGKLIGVVIRPEGFFKREVVLPIRFISRADDLALFADLTESDVDQLKPFDAES